MNWLDLLEQCIQACRDDIVGVRRHLHMNPEVSGQERATSLYLYQLLGDVGLEVTMGPEGRGVIADNGVPEELASSRIALRADIDALRIHDAKSVSYRSSCDGFMHACGHDAHSAMVYGAVRALNELQQQGALPWPVPIRTILQPAEETSEGAKAMIGVGALDNVRAIVGTHVDPTLEVGKIGVRTGVMTANCDQMRITIIGEGGHAARPHEASDPIAAAAQFINAIYMYVPRVTDSRDAVVVTIGQIQGGDTANVIPERVVLRGTIRSLNQAVREQTQRHIERLANGISQTSDTTIRVECSFGSSSIFNDAGIVALIRQAGNEVLADDGVREILRPSMGSEDFSFFLEHVPGAMFRLGCRSQNVGGFPLHSPQFDIDEEALYLGSRILALTAIYWADPQQQPSGRQSPGVVQQD